MRQRTANELPRVTPRQIELLRVVATGIESQCYSPTIAELARQLGLSRSTVFEHIGELRRKGLLEASPGRARSLRLSGAGRDLLERMACGCDCGGTGEADGIALAGRVAAGLPVEAVQSSERLSLSACFGSGDDLFALEVQGDSMVESDIRQGDYVICRRSALAEDGQVVVAEVGEEGATLKRFYREQGRARLQPANEDYCPIYSEDCRIEGVVVGLVRRL